jgi:hypothetical protein
LNDHAGRKTHIDGVFVLLLFGVFATCILTVLLLGVGSYRRLTERDARNFDRYTCLQYVAAKVRHADAAGDVFVGDFDGTPAAAGDTLFLSERADGEICWTRIYCCDGYIRELFTAAGGGFAPEDGEVVLEAQSLDFSLDPEGGLLHFDVTDADGSRSGLTLALRSGEGGTR